MPGAEQIGEAFIELGAKKGGLRKDLDDAKRMTSSTFNEMGKMSDRVGSSLLQFGKAAVGAAGIGGGFATTVKGLQAGADAQGVVMDQIAKLGEKFGGPEGIRQLNELHAVIEEVNKATQHSIPVLTLQRTALLLLQNSIKPTVNLFKSLIGHSGQLNTSLEETAQRFVAVRQTGAPAIDLFKVPTAPQAPGDVQAQAVQAAGLKRFDAYIAKLNSLPGLLKKTSALISNLWARFGLGLGVLTGKAPDEKDLLNIAEAASGAQRFLGKTAEQSAKRAFFKPGTGQMLSDEEIGRMPPFATPLPPPLPFPSLVGPPEPIGERTGLQSDEAVDSLKNIVDRLDEIMELRKQEGTLVTEPLIRDVGLGG